MAFQGIRAGSPQGATEVWPLVGPHPMGARNKPPILGNTSRHRGVSSGRVWSRDRLGEGGDGTPSCAGAGAVRPELFFNHDLDVPPGQSPNPTRRTSAGASTSSTGLNGVRSCSPGRRARAAVTGHRRGLRTDRG